MAISALRFYELYTALSLHFKDGTKYDAVKYGFKTRVSEASLLKAKGKYFFEKFSMKVRDEEEAILFLASNFIAGEKWIGGFKKDHQIKFESYKESIEYKFSEDRNIYFKDGYASIKEYVENMINNQDFQNMDFFILCNIAMNGKLLEKLSIDLDDNFLFEDFKSKVNTLQSLYNKCWGIDETKKKALLEILQTKPN